MGEKEGEVRGQCVKFLTTLVFFVLTFCLWPLDVKHPMATLYWDRVTPITEITIMLFIMTVLSRYSLATGNSNRFPCDINWPLGTVAHPLLIFTDHWKQ